MGRSHHHTFLFSTFFMLAFKVCEAVLNDCEWIFRVVNGTHEKGFFLKDLWGNVKRLLLPTGTSLSCWENFKVFLSFLLLLRLWNFQPWPQWEHIKLRLYGQANKANHLQIISCMQHTCVNPSEWGSTSLPHLGNVVLGHQWCTLDQRIIIKYTKVQHGVSTVSIDGANTIKRAPVRATVKSDRYMGWIKVITIPHLVSEQKQHQ